MIFVNEFARSYPDSSLRISYAISFSRLSHICRRMIHSNEGGKIKSTRQTDSLSLNLTINLTITSIFKKIKLIYCDKQLKYTSNKITSNNNRLQTAIYSKSFLHL